MRVFKGLLALARWTLQFVSSSQCSSWRVMANRSPGRGYQLPKRAQATILSRAMLCGAEVPTLVLATPATLRW